MAAIPYRLPPARFSDTLPQRLSGRSQCDLPVLASIERGGDSHGVLQCMWCADCRRHDHVCGLQRKGRNYSRARPFFGVGRHVAGMLAYVTIIPAIIFRVVEPYNKSRFVRFHAWQSIFFNVAWWILWIGLRIVVHLPFLGFFTLLVWPLVGLGGLIVWIILVMKANQGQMFKLPVIGDLAEKQANAA